MLFNSIQYIVLLSLSLAGYWTTSNLKIRQLIIFVASCWFYSTWSLHFLGLLIATVLINWCLSFKIQKRNSSIWLKISFAVNLGLLIYFKYANFFIQNVFYLFGHENSWALQNIILPLGISFYVFELISYQVDLYKKKIVHEQNFIVFANFVLFFPHLIAGPICRASQFFPQIKTLQHFDSNRFLDGVYIFFAGFCLKTTIADGLSPFVNVIFATPDNYSGFDNFMGVIGFGVQILCDFWGYSLMAVGAAALFGFILPHNFDLPYAAVSIRDFWRRWHITLSNWLRDYLYIWLGGSRVDKEWKVYKNLTITMLLGGLWHGASWNFILWGGIHGVALSINRWFGSSKLQIINHIKLTRWFSIFSWATTMIVVFFAWIFFRAENFDKAYRIIQLLFSESNTWSETKLTPAFFELLLLYIPLQWFIHYTTCKINFHNIDFGWKLTCIPLLIYISSVYFVNGTDFIYFQF